MKSAILLLAVFTAVFTSCSTAYKTGQTPDDVYYSPVPPREEYVKTEKQEDRRYQYTDDYYDDRYLRMKVSNRYRWNDLNDWYYYERYGFGHNYYFGSYYNPYNSWNYYYNPYCCCYGNGTGYGGGFGNPKTIAYRPQVKPRVFNLGGYTNTNLNSNTSATRPARTQSGRSSNTETYNNRNKSQGRGLGNTIRNILSGNENNSGSSNSSTNSTRTYTPSNNSSSSSSSSSGSSGSSGGGVSRPTRN